MTRQYKGWWFLSVLALFTSGFIGYHYVLRSLFALIDPTSLVLRMQAISGDGSFFNVLLGHWKLLATDAMGWVVLVLSLLIGTIVLLALTALSIMAMLTILSGIKLRKEGKKFDVFYAIGEAWLHIKPALLYTILLYAFTQVLLAALAPVILKLPGFADVMVYVVLGILFIIISLLSTMTFMNIVQDDLRARPAFFAAKGMLVRYWKEAVLMLLAHLAIIFILALVLLIIVSLVVIPVVVAGYILTAYDFVDITQYLPQVIFYGLLAFFVVVGTLYHFFQLATWMLFVQELEQEDMVKELSF